VVVPTDFSQGALLSLERALHLPLGPKSKVTLLHVLPDDIPGRLRKEAIAEAERSLEKMLARVRTLAVRRELAPSQFVADVVEGDPAEQILKRAHTVEADVICMGRQGRSAIAELLIGSTAHKVVKLGDVPVLLVRGASVNAYRRTLIAVDLSQGSASQLKAAKPYVEDAMELEVLHAASVSYEDFVLVPLEHAEQARDAAVKGAKEELSALVRKAGLVRAESKVLGGDARLLITEEGKAFGAELIIVGTHGLKGAKRIIVGSVAEWVMSNASCDVLVTRS
jgi:nucleotide-binding universal stress UspA family protein